MGMFDAIRRAEARRDANQADHQGRMEEFERQHAADREERRQFVIDHCEPATPREYAAWLAGYLRSGGEVSDIYDYPMTNRGVTVVGNGDLGQGPLEVAPSDLSWFLLRSRPWMVPSLHGALSVHVIVPATVAFGPNDLPRTFHDACGHSTFYFMQAYRVVGHSVPLFPDVLAILNREG